MIPKYFERRNIYSTKPSFFVISLFGTKNTITFILRRRKKMKKCKHILFTSIPKTKHAVAIRFNRPTCSLFAVKISKNNNKLRNSLVIFMQSTYICKTFHHRDHHHNQNEWKKEKTSIEAIAMKMHNEYVKADISFYLYFHIHRWRREFMVFGCILPLERFCFFSIFEHRDHFLIGFILTLTVSLFLCSSFPFGAFYFLSI